MLDLGTTKVNHKGQILTIEWDRDGETYQINSIQTADGFKIEYDELFRELIEMLDIEAEVY